MIKRRLIVHGINSHNYRLMETILYCIVSFLLQKGIIMNDTIKLYGELNALLNLSPAQQQVMWSALSKYNITQLSSYDNWEDSSIKFLNAKRCDGLSDATIRNYALQLRLFSRFTNDLAPAVVTVDTLREYLIYLTDVKELRKSSIQQYYNIIRTFFNWLEVEGMIQSNPTRRISVKADSLLTRHPIEESDLPKVEEACESVQEQAMVQFMLSTGCRLSEVQQLDYSDVDFTHNSVKVLGKGSKERYVYFDGKTARLLRELHEQTPSGNDALFRSSRAPYGRLSNAGIEAVIRRIGERAGVHLYPHRFRHTFATQALERGMDLMTIQKLMGHTSPAVTQVYAELSQKLIREKYREVFG